MAIASGDYANYIVGSDNKLFEYVDPVILEEFIAKLETTSLRQCTGRLNYGDSYCALGIAWLVLDEQNRVMNYSPRYNDLTENGFGSFDIAYLQELNDFAKMSFKKIAAEIKERLIV